MDGLLQREIEKQRKRIHAYIEREYRDYYYQMITKKREIEMDGLVREIKRKDLREIITYIHKERWIDGLLQDYRIKK